MASFILCDSSAGALRDFAHLPAPARMPASDCEWERAPSLVSGALYQPYPEAVGPATPRLAGPLPPIEAFISGTEEYDTYQKTLRSEPWFDAVGGLHLPKSYRKPITKLTPRQMGVLTAIYTQGELGDRADEEEDGT